MMENVYDQTGRIFDIQRYSLHDGPGIRTIVFFKGCHLRCRWCCNPESQEYGIQTMNMNGTTKTVGRDVTVRELMSDLEKDRVYYERSGGLTTAIETTAFADRAVVERLIPHVDYVLMDIKHMDPDKHRAFTGQSNEQILSNARWIAEHAASLTIRVPTIPTFNATEGEITAIARFACAASAPLPPSGAG